MMSRCNSACGVSVYAIDVSNVVCCAQRNSKELIPQNFQDLDEIMGGRESVNPQHVIESSDIALSQEDLEKSILDEEIYEA